MNQQTRREGPALSALLHRLQYAPEFLVKGNVPDGFYALVHDVVYACDPHFSAGLLQPFTRPAEQCRWYATSALLAYVLGDELFCVLDLNSADLVKVLSDSAQLLEQTGNNRLYIEDMDRREEFVRVLLHDLGLRPQGESEKQAEYRLQTVSSAERLRVVEAARVAEERARNIREALARKQAQEAADKMSRE